MAVFNNVNPSKREHRRHNMLMLCLAYSAVLCIAASGCAKTSNPGSISNAPANPTVEQSESKQSPAESKPASDPASVKTVKSLLASAEKLAPKCFDSNDADCTKFINDNLLPSNSNTAIFTPGVLKLKQGDVKVNSVDTDSGLTRLTVTMIDPGAGKPAAKVKFTVVNDNKVKFEQFKMTDEGRVYLSKHPELTQWN